MRKITFLSLMILILVCVGFQDTLAQLPKTISYQAKLVDEANQPLNRNVTITFSIYDQESGGNPLWVEPQDVTAVNGYVNVYLGEFNPMNLDFSKQYWLEIQVGAGNPYSPRTKLSTSPYSISSSFAKEAGIANSVANQAVTLNALAPEVLAAGGDLEGNFPNPTIKASAIASKISNGSISIDMLSPEVREYLSPLGGDITGVPSNARIKANAVRTVNIQDASITKDKIANASIGLSHLDQNIMQNFINSTTYVGNESDLTGTFATLKVAKINGVPINTTVPLTNGAVYMYDNINDTWVPAVAGGAITGPYSNLTFNTTGANNGDVLKFNSSTGSVSWAADNGITLPFSGTSNGNINAFQITQSNINGASTTTAIKGENLDAQGQAAYFINSNPNSVKPTVSITNTSTLHNGTAFEAYKNVLQSDLTIEPREPHYVGKIYDTDQTTPGGRGLYIESNTPRTSDPGTINGITYNNWSSWNHDPMDKDEATLVVRNNSNDENKIAIKTYGDIVANSWLYASDGLVLGGGEYSTQLTPPNATLNALKISGNLRLIDGSGNIAGTIEASNFVGGGAGVTGILPSNIDQAGAALNNVLTWDGTAWVPMPGGGTETDPMFFNWLDTANVINSWNNAATWVTSNGANVTGWDAASTWVTNNGANATNWNNASTWVTNNSSKVTGWDAASTWVTNNGANVTNWNNASDWVATNGANATNWNIAYGWGNHATEGYLDGTSSINDLSDVNTSGVSTNQFLQWNGTNWIPAFVPDGVNQLAQLTDVNLTGLTNNQFLQWNGTSWVPATLNTGNWDAASDWVSTNGANATNWNTAYGWGNHATEGYLTSSAFSSTPAGSITNPDITNWNTASTWVSTNGANSTNWDEAYNWVNSNGAAILATTATVDANATNWNTAYGWGDHSTEGYLKNINTESINDLSDVNTSGALTNQYLQFDGTNWIPATIPTGITTLGGLDDVNVATVADGNFLAWNATDSEWQPAIETDPIFSSSAANGILASDVTNWNTAYGWGDHSTEGYINLPFAQTYNDNATLFALTNNGNGAVAEFNGTSFTSPAVTAQNPNGTALLVNGVLQVNGDAGFNDDVFITNDLFVNDVYPSNIISSGYLQVAEDAGIGQDLFVTNDVYAANFIGNVDLYNLNQGTATDGQALIWNGTTNIWEPGTINIATSLDQLTDVVLTSPANGQFLQYDGTNWVNSTLNTTNWDLAYSWVNTNGAATLATTATVDAGSGNWDNAYSWVNTNGAATLATTATVDAGSGNWDNAYSWVNTNGAATLATTATVDAGSGNWDNAYSWVNTNGAATLATTATVDANSTNWDNAYTWVNTNGVATLATTATVDANSTNWDNAYTWVNTNGAATLATTATVDAGSTNWDNAYSWVNTNGAATLATTATVDAGSTNWDNAYSWVNTNGAATLATTATVDAGSGNWDNAYSWVNTNGAATLATTATVDAGSTNWDNAYSWVNTNGAATLATTATVDAGSTNWDNAYSWVNTNGAATLATTATVDAGSGNWDNAYSWVNTNGAATLATTATVDAGSTNWNDAYTWVSTTGQNVVTFPYANSFGDLTVLDIENNSAVNSTLVVTNPSGLALEVNGVLQANNDAGINGDLFVFGTTGIFTSGDVQATNFYGNVGLDNLNDGGAGNGDVLTWNGTSWAPGTISVATSLDELTDVVLTAPVGNGQFLQYDGTNWVNSTLNTTNWDNAYSWVNTNGAATLATTATVDAGSGNWDNAYSWVNTNGAATLATTATVDAGSGNWDNAYSWVNTNGAATLATTATVDAGSGNWDNAYSWVNTNGAATLATTATVDAGSGNWDNAYSWVNTNGAATLATTATVDAGSGNWDNAYSWVNTNGAATLATTATVDANSTNWDNAYTWVNTNGAATLATTATVDANSTNWDNAYTWVNTNGAATLATTATVDANSTNWDNAYTWVNTNGVATLATTATVDANSTNWDNAYSWVNTNGAATLATTATVDANSTNWDNAYTWVNTNGVATLATTATVDANSTNWDNAYTWVNTNGAATLATTATVDAGSTNWDNAYSWVNTNGAATLATTATVDAGSGNWDNAYSWVNTNGAATLATTATVDAGSTNWNDAYTWVSTTGQNVVTFPYANSFGDLTVLDIENNSAVNSTLVVTNPSGLALEVNGAFQANDDAGVNGDLFVFGTTGIVASGDVYATNFIGNVGLDNLNQGGAVNNDVLTWNGTTSTWEPQTIPGVVETDPVFNTWYTTSADITNWNTAFGWGNHAAAGYLTSYTETDPFFSGSAASLIALADISNWNTAFNWGDHSTVGYLTNINGLSIDELQDVNTLGAIPNQFLQYDGANWIPANIPPAVDELAELTDVNLTGLADANILSWNNASSEWQPVDVAWLETDPVFGASAANGILGTDIANWNTAYSWGDHSAAGYLTSYTETDPEFNNWYTTSADVTNWNTAFGWGNHATAGYLTSYTETDPEFNNWYTTSADVTNWNTAFGWGDHSTVGYLELPYTGVFGDETVLNLTNNSNMNGTLVVTNLMGGNAISVNGDVNITGDMELTGDAGFIGLTLFDDNGAGDAMMVLTGTSSFFDNVDFWADVNGYGTSNLIDFDAITANTITATTFVGTIDVANNIGNGSIGAIPYQTDVDETGFVTPAVGPGQILTSVLDVNGIDYVPAWGTQVVDAANIFSNAVTEDKIDFWAVTEDKIADGAVTNGKIAQMAATDGMALIWSDANTQWEPQDITFTEQDPIFDTWYNTVGGDVTNWNNTATTVTAGSAGWDVASAWVTANGANTLTTTATVNAGSVNWDAASAWVTANGANTLTTTATVNAGSANWDAAFSWGNHAAAGYLELPYTGVFGDETVLNLTNSSNANSTLVITNTNGVALSVNGLYEFNGDGGFIGLTTFDDNGVGDAIIVTQGLSSFYDNMSIFADIDGNNISNISNFNSITSNTITVNTDPVNSYTFPATRGANGQILKTDGAGNVTWQNDAGFNGVTIDATLTGDGTAGNALGLNLANANTWTENQTFPTAIANTFQVRNGADVLMHTGRGQSDEGYLKTLSPAGNPIVTLGSTVNGTYGAVSVGTGDGIANWRASMVYLDAATTGNPAHPLNDNWMIGTGDLTTGNGTILSYGASNNRIAVYDNNINFDAPSFLVENDGDLFANAITANTNTAESYAFPTTRGTNGQVLTSDGAGSLTWETVSFISTLQGAYNGGNEIEVDNNLPVTYTAAAGYNGQRIMSIYNEGNVQGLSIETNNDQNVEATLFVTSNAGSGVDNYGSAAIFEITNPNNRDYAVGISTLSNQTDATALQVTAGGNVGHALNVSGNSVLTSFSNTNGSALLEANQEGTGPGIVINSNNLNNNDIALVVNSNAGDNGGMGSAASFNMTNPNNQDYAVGIFTASNNPNARALEVTAGGNNSIAINALGNSEFSSLNNANTGNVLAVVQEGTGSGIVVEVNNAASIEAGITVTTNADDGIGILVNNTSNDNTATALQINNGKVVLSSGEVPAEAGNTDLTNYGYLTVIRIIENAVGATTINANNLPTNATNGQILYIINSTNDVISSDLGNIAVEKAAMCVYFAGSGWVRIQ